MILIFEGDEESIINQIISTLHDKKKVIQISTEEVSILTFPGLTIQPYQHRVLQDGKEVSLSHLEFATLLFWQNIPDGFLARPRFMKPSGRNPERDVEQR